MAHVFVTRKQELAEHLEQLRGVLAQDGDDLGFVAEEGFGRGNRYDGGCGAGSGAAAGAGRHQGMRGGRGVVGAEAGDPEERAETDVISLPISRRVGGGAASRRWI